MRDIDDDGLLTALRRLREVRPLVHNITNDVVMNITANALLAAGASPAMVHAPQEAAEFVRVASALVVNIGSGHPTTLDRLLESLEFAVAPARFDTVRHPARSTDTNHSTLDATLAREALGWSPTVSLDEGVAKMWHWRASQ